MSTYVFILFCSVTSVVSLERRFHFCSMADPSLPVDFSRQKLAEFIHKLTRHVMSTCEDDTKSLLALVSVSQSRAVYLHV